MPQSLGKRKEREGEDNTEARSHGLTLFVSNLPYSATSTDLKTLFSDTGPVRTAFVVLDHDSGSSKGVGYVTFAIREDAQVAYETVNGGEGLVLDGRKLRVDWAGNKPHKDKEQQPKSPVKKEPTGDEKPVKKPPQLKVAYSAGPSDPLAIRTIVISGLPTDLDSKALWKKMRKYDGAEKVDWLAHDGTSAHVLFATPAQAQAAVGKLHAHVFKGALLSVTLKKRLDTIAKAGARAKIGKAASAGAGAGAPGTGTGTGTAPSRASRLIVRNLPFDVTEQDLRAVFLPYGPIHSIHIPIAESKTEMKKEEEGVEEEAKPQMQAQNTRPPPPRGKGYAFVWMLSRKDAEQALEGANGARIWAGMADGMVRDKQKKKKLRREEAKKQKEKERKIRVAAEKAREKEGKMGKEVNEEGENSASESEEEEEENMAVERIIAVDWALSKDKWEEAKAKLLEAQGEDEEAEDDSSDKSDHGEGSGSDSNEEDIHLGVHEGDSDDESGSEHSDDEGMDVDEAEDEDEKPSRPQLPATDVGTTLFIRNVPFEATEDELRTVFRTFGPLRYARITMEHETGRSRGTGFVCFWNKEDADKAIEQSEILRQETTGSALPPALKKNPFKLPSLLTPDPSASVAKNLVLHGRTLDVSRAVTRDEAVKLKEIGERQREKADKRNLYLLREGTILPNTPAAEGLNAADLEKRTQSFNARKALLRSNPSLFVSRTRLSVRQIPLFVAERMLKRLGIHAVRAFNAEVKDGARASLTADELAEPLPDPDADEDDVEAKGKGKGKGKGKFEKKGRSTGVQQSKMVRQQDRVDALTGKGRSKGYGFLEMEKHADALRVLRWANNNPAVNELFDQWWTEELQQLLEVEKKKPNKDKERMERIQAELEQGAQKRSRGMLIVEFSIENVQVVKRRATLQEERRHNSTPSGESKKASRRPGTATVKKEPSEPDAPTRKKTRLSKEPSLVKPEKPGAKLGSVIGRKRKERRAKKKA